MVNQWKDLRIQFTTEEQKLRIIGTDEIKYLREHTKLEKIDLNGEDIIPGDIEVPSKLTVSSDDSFAFLNLLPDDIQPAIVGDYDFIASVSSEQLIDPIALQENFFTALEKVAHPVWIKGLATQNKQLNFQELTSKIFEKLHLGLETENLVTDLRLPEGNETPQPISPDQVSEQLSVQPQNPFPSLEDIQGGASGGA